MTDKKETSVFKLSVPLKVQYKLDGKNDYMDIEEIHIKAPSYKEWEICLRIKKKFFEAMFSMASSTPRGEAENIVKQEEEDKFTTEQMNAILLYAKDFDIVDFYNRFKSLFTIVAFKEEAMAQKLLHMEIERMDKEDFEDLIAHYIQVFFISSWMKALN